MGTISVTLPNDGETIDAADVNTPINTVVTLLNGNLDNANISASAAITGSKLATASLDLGSLASVWDGWIAVSDSWSYASATTITVPTNATTKYSVGDKIKLVQSSTTKYFYITAVAATTLTVTGGADYSVANSPISGIYYSKASTPLNFPAWFNYTETWTGFTATVPTGGNVRFCINGRTVTYHINRTTPGTSNATSVTVTLPVTAASQTGGWANINGRVYDNGAEAAGAGLWLIASGGTTASLYVANGSNWTNVNGKDWRGIIVYEI